MTKREYSLKEEWMKWQWQSEGDVFVNGAYFKASRMQEGCHAMQAPSSALQGNCVDLRELIVEVVGELYICIQHIHRRLTKMFQSTFYHTWCICHTNNGVRNY